MNSILGQLGCFAQINLFLPFLSLENIKLKIKTISKGLIKGFMSVWKLVINPGTYSTKFKFFIIECSWGILKAYVKSKWGVYSNRTDALCQAPNIAKKTVLTLFITIWTHIMSFIEIMAPKNMSWKVILYFELLLMKKMESFIW